MSERLLLPRSSDSKFVNPDSAEMSERLLPDRVSDVKFVNPDSAEISEMRLTDRRSVVRFVAFSNPVRLRIFRFAALCRPDALREVNVFISASVTTAVAARFAPRALLIAARRRASGMFTFCATTGGAPESNTTPTIRQNIISFVIKCSQMFIQKSP